MNVNVFKQLQSLSPIEIEQKKKHSFCDDIPQIAIDSNASQIVKIPVLNEYFFKNCSVCIRKHNRFAPYPLHTHQFFEINYILQGHAVEYVNGQRIELLEGDILLLDIGSQHKINMLSKNDLMINILFRDRNISIDLINQAQAKQSILYDFLLKHKDTTAQDKNNFLLFKNRGGNTQEIRIILDSLITEYYQQREFSDTIIQAQLTILISYLIRNYEMPTIVNSPSQELSIKILDDIHSHYQKISLKDLASKYGYNKNYLSNLFHKEVGKPFSEVLTDERLLRARELIQSTTKPIGDICQEVGLSNKSFFYHKYVAKFSRTPKEDRQRANIKSIISTL